MLVLQRCMRRCEWLSAIVSHGANLNKCFRGFVEEGRLRKALWFDGEWIDIVLMSILEDEWAERQRLKYVDFVRFL